MQLILTNDVAEVRRLVAEGFCPVECSIGGESFVDGLKMDHHGHLSHLESVAIRAYRDHRGARKYDPRFVVVGAADADASFAVAALAGILPDGLEQLAETVSILDTDPIGRDITKLPRGADLLAWRILAGDGRDTLGLYAAVAAWRTALGRDGALLRESALKSESARIEEANKAVIVKAMRGLYRCDQVFVAHGSDAWGFDVWYGRVAESPCDSASGWKHPVIVAYNAKAESITVGCPNVAVAEALFGPGGLKNAWPKLGCGSAGWGGRETVGGSPRGEKMTMDQAFIAACDLQAVIRERAKEIARVGAYK